MFQAFQRPIAALCLHFTADPLASREATDRVLGALAQLTTEHRLVVSLFAIKELRHEQIAAILGVPVGTVWSRLHTARKQLAQVLLPPARD